MSDTPVSVIIPTYNRAASVCASVNSVLQQTHRELEVIVVDDCSSDDTEQCLAAINDSRLHYHRLEKNGGAAHARNIGVGLAAYETIAFNDSDDLWHPDKLEKQLAHWSTRPDDVIVYCAYKVDLPDGGILKIPGAPETQETLSGNIFYYLLLRPTIGTPTMMIKKNTFLQLGGFNTDYPACEDWDFTLRAARLGSVGYLDEILLTVEASAPDRLSASQVKHYQARCMMLADYQDDINAIGQFDLYAGYILESAEKDGLVEPVKRMMMLCLQQKALEKEKTGTGS
ncbi:MAG: glycosyltransferase family 2 protein [Lachnospiraceae bacterium]|nr:glycosyltransferase family 2 protein [Lachnospiraceae bacterium]